MKNRFVLIVAVGFFVVTGASGQAPPDPGEKRDNPTGNTGALKAQIETGGSYDAHSGNGTRIVTDLRIPGALGVYGLDFTRYWNSTQNDFDHSEAEIPIDFGQSGWSHSWRWSAVVGHEYPDEIPGSDNDNNIYKTTITITFPDGHLTKYKISRVRHGQWLVPPGDPVWGPPYSAAEIASGWPYGGVGVHDHICNMAENGSQFWLCRADGGSVHFVWIPQGVDGYYQAKEVFDPHGLKTTLTYNAGGLLERVEQDGGRYLTIVWSYFPSSGWLITRVESGGPSGGAQHVSYIYKKQNGPYHILTLVRYEDDPAPGQQAFAVYTYGSCYGDETEPCDSSGQTPPLLKRADDPHYAGAMTKIRYNYAGDACQPILIHPEFHPEWVGGQPYRIAAEKSDAGDVVSRFLLDCDGGEREEWNGLGGHRRFYFGNSAGTLEGPPANLFCRGFQLGGLTNFVSAGIPFVPGTPCPPGVGWQRQNFSFGQPRHIWDGRNNRTEQFETSGDDSGSPGEVHYADQSSTTYDRVNPGNSPLANGIGMHNPYNHWLFNEKDERGNVTVYTRDSRRRVTQIAYYNGPAQGTPAATESYSYNDWNQVEMHIVSSGAEQHYQYDGCHRLFREWNSVDGSANYTEYGYDNLDRAVTVQNPLARSRYKPFSAMMEYNGRNQVTKVTYPSTGSGTDPFVRYEYDSYGNCTAVIDELGHRKDYTYDSYRRCTSLTEQVNSSGANCPGVVSRRWDWIYDRVIEGQSGDPLHAYAHTSKEWRAQVEPAFNSNGQRRVTARAFDVNNRIVSEQTGVIQPPGEIGPGNPWFNGPDTETHYFTYDPNGQKETYKDPLGRITTYEYDIRNRLERTIEPRRDNQPVPVTRIEYDVAGNKTVITFPDGKTQRWENYDAFGQAWRFFDERNNPTDLIYQWGPMKKLAQVTTHRESGGGWEHQPTTFSYDPLGRPTQTLFPDGTDEFSSYLFGQIDTFKTRRNQTKRLHYDVRGREDYHTWDAGAASRIDRVWDEAHRLTQIWNSFSVIDYEYDDGGQMRTEKTTVTGTMTPREVRYCRYPSGDVSRVTYPNGTTVDRNYTSRGQLQGETWTGGSVTYAYLHDGKVDYQDYGNGVRSDLDYDGRGFVKLTNTFRQSSPPQTYAKRDYWRDDRDRIVAWQKGSDFSANPMENGRGDRYEYDEEGQLTRASYQAENPSINATGAQRADWFHYDALGNRFGWNDVANRGSMWFDRRNNNKLNQYQSWYNSYPNPPLHWGSAIYHDDNFPTVPPRWIPPGNGVTMADGWIVASYNALNQPVAIGCTGYGNDYMWFWHDPLGRCVKRWMGDVNQQPVGSNPITYFYYDGWNLIQEGSTAVATDRAYIHGNRVDEIVASWTPAGNWLYHHYDARGHCILQTNTSGALQEQYDYDAFGWPYFYTASGAPAKVNGKPGSPSGNRFLFTGREFLSGLRIYDYRNRMYQPELGRFLQPDPKQFEAGDYNLYRYCHNDPINHSDPTGLDLRIDSYDPAEKAALEAIVARVAQTPEGAAALQTMVDANFDNVIMATLPGMENETMATDGANANNPAVGSRVIITMQLTASTRTRSDGTKETVPASVKAGHEIGHGASTNMGQQAPENPNATGANYIKQPSESKSDSVKVEDAVRKVERLKPRD